MALPYHVLTACGRVIFAARGGNIYSFSPDLQHLSAWKYPAKQAKAANGSSLEAKASPVPEEPPTKRRRVEPGKEEDSNGNGHAIEGDAPNAKGNKQLKKEKKVQDLSHRLFEQPYIQSITTTTNGRYVVAVTGSDKTIWVFEHDGAGNLKQLSSRTMPKRPCSIAITPDSQTILSADKFGDVYAVPLLQSAADQQQAESKEATPAPDVRSATPSSTTIAQPFKPQANEFTVHTKRNLRALENQKLGLQTKGGADKPAEPAFEHTLLLGHVSMLTAVVVGVHPATRRSYIVTGDRDEHIRVSRGAPAQAHIIETFCLGHEDFVSRLCLPAPAARPEVLVSGGGDDHLFVWDWTRGALLSKASVLAHVQRVVPQQRNIAVSRIYACPAGHGEDGSVLVFVVCERVPALFCFEFKGNTLYYHATIATPGNPLDVTNVESGSSSPSPRLLLAVDTITLAESQGGFSLFWADWEAALGWRLRSCQETPVMAGGDEPTFKPEDLHKILYTTESLRKTTDFE
ncbi:hypothetical protein B0H67DRAFT_477957 [Lasiosphaeris hirsuta]|uniref:Transfer RNA methyltransferase 82 n=1 Tax=Lasiosphaeris hirsuta TaxID=260670 RepID=A0AA40BC93_9PEZI|nr:hypothetical protein B0H67DRAFT_477957 [Lasiosphaeris hirsuta]